MVEEKKTLHFSKVGIFEFMPLTFQSSGKGEIALRYEDGKEISLDRLWGKYLGNMHNMNHVLLGRWVNLDIELLDYDEKKDSNLIKEIVDKKINDKDDIEENTEEDATKDVKIITKTEKGTLFVKPYTFIDRMGWSEKSIIGLSPHFGVVNPISLNQLLEKFIGREVILTLRMEDSDEDEEEEDFY